LREEADSVVDDMAGVHSTSEEAAAIDESRRAKALDDARLLHYPPEVLPPDMVSR